MGCQMTKSVGEIRRRLPDAFIEEISARYSPVTVDRILLGLSGGRDTTLRVNSLRAHVQDVMRVFQKKNIRFARVPWYRDALDLKNADERAVRKLDLYAQGAVYLQSLSSMLPPLALAPEPGEKVLDLTAAPGSKTTQLAALMGNRGEILANELDKVRCERLRYNVETQGAGIVTVRTGPGEKVGEAWPDAFDRVLLDAPCSGEGRFLANRPVTYRGWSEREVRRCAGLQKKLLQSACRALKPGGVLVYSTCTLNLVENEQVLDWALQALPLEMRETGLQVPGGAPAFTEGFDPSVGRALRVLPSQTMEGFFVAKLQKKRG